MASDLLTSLLSTPLAYIAVTLSVIVVIKWMLQKPANIPPFPVKPYPIVGHILHLGKSPRETIAKWAKENGDLFSIYMGPSLVVVLNSHEILKETLVKQPEHFTERPPTFTGTVAEDGSRGVLLNSGPEWKEQRSTAMNILRSLGMGKKSLAEDIEMEIGAYLKELASYKGKPAEVRTLTNASVSNVICSIIVGKRFEYDDPYFTNFMHVINEQVRLAATTTALSWFHWLRFLPGDYFNAKKLAANQTAMMNYFSDRYIKESTETLDENNVDNFIVAYLIEMKKKERNGEPTTLDNVNLRRVIANLFLAGTETTSTTILWFMLYLLHDPNVQKKVFKEIKEVVGTEREPSMNDKAKLHYLNAAITETQRMASILPLSLPHKCSADVQLRGYTIPKGTQIWPNLDAIHYDKKTWGDPTTFRPERFLDKEGNLAIPEQFIPFSLGRRICLGESLAKMELFLYLAKIIQKFELLPADPQRLPPIKGVFGVTIAPLPYEMRFVERG